MSLLKCDGETFIACTAAAAPVQSSRAVRAASSCLQTLREQDLQTLLGVNVFGNSAPDR